MNRRDRFALAAMQGIIAASGDSNGCCCYLVKPLAENAYEMADAMIAASERSARNPAAQEEAEQC